MINNEASESQVSYHRRRLTELRTVRQPWESEWIPLGEFIEPTRLRLVTANEGPRSRKSIIDSTGTSALNILKSGMHSGITSPARPWFRLTTYDPDLKDFAPVKEYLAQVEQVMRETFQSSNIYTSFHTGYGDLGQFGQSCGILAEDDTNVIRMQQLIHGRFWIARDSNGRVTTLYRQFRWSVQRIVERFGYKNVPQRIKEQYDTSKYHNNWDIWHAIEPRAVRDPTKFDKANKSFLSNYWMDEGVGSELLEESGFDGNPIICPAWELSDDDHYALSPGQIALGDIRMLQKEQTRKLEAIDKKVRPPMTGPVSMKNNPTSLLPGSITFVDDPTGKGYRPAMEVQLQLNELHQDIKDVQDRINRAFYADLFMMISNMEGIQPRNNLEIAERKEEKLLALGPVLENIYASQLEPTIDRTYDILNRQGKLPQAPAELHGMKLKIEYTSMLAQAQKAVATGAIERGFAFVGQLSAVKPEVLDKVDADEAVDYYFDYLGVPPSIVVPDDKVQAVRDQRAKQQQQMQNAEVASKMAPAAESGANAAAVLAGANQNPQGNALLTQLGLG